MPPLVCCYLLLCGLLSKAAGLPAYSSQPDPDWNQVPSEDMEDLKLVYDLTRPSRHADGLFTSGYSKLLGQMSAKDYLDSLIAKRTHGDALPAQVPIKRHSDAVFTDNYSRYRKQMAVKKYLHSVLAGRRSVEQPGMTDLSIRAEPTSQQSSPDISLDEILNQLALGL